MSPRNFNPFTRDKDSFYNTSFAKKGGSNYNNDEYSFINENQLDYNKMKRGNPNFANYYTGQQNNNRYGKYHNNINYYANQNNNNYDNNYYGANYYQNYNPDNNMNYMNYNQNQNQHPTQHQNNNYYYDTNYNNNSYFNDNSYYSYNNDSNISFKKKNFRNKHYNKENYFGTGTATAIETVNKLESNQIKEEGLRRDGGNVAVEEKRQLGGNVNKNEENYGGHESYKGQEVHEGHECHEDHEGHEGHGGVELNKNENNHKQIEQLDNFEKKREEQCVLEYIKYVNEKYPNLVKINEHSKNISKAMSTQQNPRFFIIKSFTEEDIHKVRQ